LASCSSDADCPAGTVVAVGDGIYFNYLNSLSLKFKLCISDRLFSICLSIDVHSAFLVVSRRACLYVAMYVEVKGISLLVEFYLTATECHLPYGITQCYLPPDTSEHTPP